MYNYKIKAVPGENNKVSLYLSHFILDTEMIDITRNILYQKGYQEDTAQDTQTKEQQGTDGHGCQWRERPCVQSICRSH